MAEQGIITDLRQRFDTWWNARPEPTPGQIDQERETRVSLGLMAQAADAAEPTPEQQIFLSQSEHGMRERLSVLLRIPHRSLAQEREKVAIEQWLGRNNPAPPPQTQVRGFMGAPRRFFGSVATIGGGWQVWAIAAAITLSGWGTAAVQAAIKERIEDQRDAARDAIEEIEEQRDDWKRRAEAYAQAVADARQAAQQSAAALEAERAAQARAAARERRRQREVQNVLANSPEPPAWSLRDDESVPQ